MNDFWLSFASKDLAKAKEFYTKLGLEMNSMHSGPQMVNMFVASKKITINIFSEKAFKKKAFSTAESDVLIRIPV